MDALRQTLEQYLKLLKSMSPSQRGTLIAVPLMIAGAFVLLMWNGSSSSYVALSFGKRFTSEELHLAEQSLKDAGLTEFRTEGQQIMVPAKESDRYNAAVIISNGSLSGWAEQLEAQIESEGSFARAMSSDRTLQAKKDIALSKHLRSMIRQLSDIEDGHVRWARPDPRNRRFGRGAPVTATVWVKPRSGREISSSLVSSLRAAVANSVADLKPSHVTVVDQSTGRAYTPDADGEPFDSKLIAYIDEHRQRYKKMIDEALQYIPGVLVAVEVELDSLQSSVEQETKYDPKAVAQLTIESTRTENSRQQPGRAEPGVQSNRGREVSVSAGLEKSHDTEDKQTTTLNNTSVLTTHRELIGALPKAVTVAVSIPRNHYRKIAQSRGLAPADQELDEWLQTASDADKKTFEDAVENIRQEEEAKAKASVQKLIPPGSPEDAVSVISFDATEPDVPKLEVSAIDTVTGVVSQWGGAVGLALLAFWVVRMLRKSMPQLPGDEQAPAVVAEQPTPDISELDEPPEMEPIDNTERDELQAIVRDDPDTAAAVLGKWLQAAK